jgi:hypothetical protein
MSESRVSDQTTGRMRAWVSDQSPEPSYVAAVRTLPDAQIVDIVDCLFRDGVPGFLAWEEERHDHIRKMAEFSLRFRD